ncbi:protein kinase domain-containing protein [Streptomyces coeruleorubidus]|uniref:protein kinase domain-containing protein n=1 Tax=Streptomyces coeruleorubidus TaxID=116188 RepID=UPI00340903C1
MNTGARGRGRLRGGDVLQDEFGTALKLEEQLGKGGQGEVWSVAGGRSAVKVLRTVSGEDVSRLRTRLELVRRFDLGGIPIARPLAMLDREQSGRVGYVMELLGDMTGIGSLAKPPTTEPVVDWYRRTGGLRRRLRLLTLAAEALGGLHAKAVAYADVSPDNIRVSRDSAHEQVWLIDPDNLTVGSTVTDTSVYTPGYGAPEVVGELSGCTTASDSYAFAVLAFHVLVLAHPFVGERVYEDPFVLEDDAFSGKLPWIDHPTDDRNRTRQGLPRDAVLTKGLKRLFALTFEEGLHKAGLRPALLEWRTKLDQAAMSAIMCPSCAHSYYPSSAACPWCGTVRPLLARCDLYAHVPAQPEGSGLPQRDMETGRLESLLLTSGEPVPVRARNAVVCLDRGPSSLTVDADEPVVEIAWDGRSEVTVERVGRHEVWLQDPSGERRVPLQLGYRKEIPVSSSGRWTVRFGPNEQIHCFLRFRSQPLQQGVNQ